MTWGYTLAGFPEACVYKCFIKDCFDIFHKIHRTAPVTRLIFNRVTGLWLFWRTLSRNASGFPHLQQQNLINITSYKNTYKHWHYRIIWSPIPKTCKVETLKDSLFIRFHFAGLLSNCKTNNHNFILIYVPFLLILQ